MDKEENMLVIVDDWNKIADDQKERNLKQHIKRNFEYVDDCIRELIETIDEKLSVPDRDHTFYILSNVIFIIYRKKKKYKIGLKKALNICHCIDDIATKTEAQIVLYLEYLRIINFKLSELEEVSIFIQSLSINDQVIHILELMCNMLYNRCYAGELELNCLIQFLPIADIVDHHKKDSKQRSSFETLIGILETINKK